MMQIEDVDVLRVGEGKIKSIFDFTKTKLIVEIVL
jgi:hypothetical protein